MTVAVLVVHGIGQQKPLQTRQAIVRAIKDECTIRNVPFVVGEASDNTTRILTLDGEEIKIVEVYWADLTENRISGLEAFYFIGEVYLKGILVLLNRKKYFSRIMFDKEEKLKISLFTILKFSSIVAAVILSLIGVMTYWTTVGMTVLFLLPIFIYMLDNILRKYVGDFVAYSTATNRAVRKYAGVRERIKVRCKEIFNKTFSENDKVVVIGHSLGSVIAYDTINELLKDKQNLDSLYSFVSVGSPLDKTELLNYDKKFTTPSPMTESYKNRPQRWINLYSHFDPVSGALDYFDSVEPNANEPKRVENIKDLDSPISPVESHTGYFRRPAFKKIILDLILSARDKA